MKTSFSLYLLIFAFVFSCSDKSAEYNNTLIGGNAEIVKLFNKLSEDYTLEELNSIKERIIAISDSSLSEISKIESYEGDSSFKVTAIDYYKMNKEYISTPEVYKIIQSKATDADSMKISVEEYTVFNKLDEKAELIQSKLIEEQRKFAKANNAELKKEEQYEN